MLQGVRVALLVTFILAGAGQQSEIFQKFRRIEAYEVRPGILMFPRYAANGKVCEIGIEGRAYSPQKVNLNAGLSRGKIESIFDELAPLSE